MDIRTSVLAEAADSLALAVIASSNAPVLLLDGALDVIAASETFCDAFQIDADSVLGQPLAALGMGSGIVLSSARSSRPPLGCGADRCL